MTLFKATQYVPVKVGEAYGGGFFAGYISHTADGNPTHALIVAPRAAGATGDGYTLTTNPKWADETVDVPAHATLIGASSNFDGKANTDLMMSLIADSTYSAGAFPAAQFCADLSIGGHTDWYLPARYELDIAYFNLKPGTQVNNTGWGSNIYSVPKRDNNYSPTFPRQSILTPFNTSAEAFVAGSHWSSTEAAPPTRGSCSSSTAASSTSASRRHWQARPRRPQISSLTRPQAGKQPVTCITPPH
jgi:hypothetical protein